MPETADFDHEFMTTGNPVAEGEKLEALIQQNLSPEEQAFIEKVTPIVSQFMDLIAKAQGGQENVPINEQEQAMMTPPAMEVAQDMGNEQMAPLQAVEGQMPKAALGGRQKVVPTEESGQIAAAGPVGVVNTQGADGSGTADDVPTESDGFVINAAAVRKIGVRKLYDLIEEAIAYLQEKGIKLDTSKIPMDAEKILVSKGEVIIPDIIAAVIGYDKLEEMNAVGIDETKQIAEEQQPNLTKPPIIQAAEGVNLQEEKTEGFVPMEIGDRPTPPSPDLSRDEQLKKMQQEIEVNKILDEKKTKPSKTDFVPMEIGDRPTEKKIIPYTITDPDPSIPFNIAINKVWSPSFNPTKAIRGPKFNAQIKTVENIDVLPEVLNAIPKGMNPFKKELKELGLYTPSLFEHFARMESVGGTKRIGEKPSDQGVFMLNLDNFDRLVNPKNKKYDEADWKNFKDKIWGPLATQTHGMDSDQLREFWLSDPEKFKDRNLKDISFNLSMVIAVTLLPNKEHILYTGQ